MPRNSSTVDFFVSYTKRDEPWAEWIAWVLESNSYHVILQKWDFNPGTDFLQEIRDSAKRAKRVVAILSPEYFESVFTALEWVQAHYAGKLLPVRISQFDIPTPLASLTYIDLVEKNEATAKEHLLEGVQCVGRKSRLSRAFPAGCRFPGAPPLLVPINDLIPPRPNHTFTVCVLQNAITLESRAQEIESARIFDQYSRNVELRVELSGLTHGICNNAGKVHMLERWGRDAGFAERCSELSRQVLEVQNGKRHALRIECDQLPLRWASGGVLPVVEWRNRTWLALFFRDIEPIGLNIANGASESPVEWLKLDQLMLREFGEELLVLADEKPDYEHMPYLFDDPQISINVNRFASQHIEMRKQHDGMWIPGLGTQRIPIRRAQTPYEACVTDRHGHEWRTKDVLFSINPGEFGIEVVSVQRMHLPEKCQLLDGEIAGTGTAKWLVRRPVVLLELQALRTVCQSGGFGDPLRDGENFECKRLPASLGPSHVHVFDLDLKARTRRAKHISDLGEASYRQEAEWLRTWDRRYANKFARASREGVLEGELRLLCPVAWKALELAFETGVLP